MARVLALTADLLFGSRVQGALVAAGYEVELVCSADALAARLSAEAAGTEPDAAVSTDPARPDRGSRSRPSLLVVDLVDAQLDGAGAVESLRSAGALDGVRTLGFYSHVDTSARERAERAGFDLVVARSRMAREGAQLVGSLLA